MRLDLNLLVALEALLDTQSVSRAADRVGLSQPAMSHALARLRSDFGDPLLVRVGHAMQCTPRADALRGALAEALDHVRGLYRAESFDPATATRSFRATMPDVIAAPLLPGLVSLIEEEAPGCRLNLVPWPGWNPDAVTARSLDLAICNQEDAFPGFRPVPLFDDRDVLVVRAGHTVLNDEMTAERFLQLPQVAVVPARTPLDPVDEWLVELGLARRVALGVPHYLQALHLAARTDLGAVLPRRLVAQNAKALGLVAIELPIDPGVDQQWLFYPIRAEADPASLWLRAITKKAARL